MAEFFGLPLDLVLDGPGGHGLGTGLDRDQSPVVGLVLPLEGHGPSTVDVLHRPVLGGVDNPATDIDGLPSDHLSPDSPGGEIRATAAPSIR